MAHKRDPEGWKMSGRVRNNDDDQDRRELRERLKEGARKLAERDLRLDSKWFPLAEEALGASLRGKRN